MALKSKASTASLLPIEKDAFNQWGNLCMTNSLEKQAQMRQNFIAAMKFQDITVES
jgi:hypothetical protein